MFRSSITSILAALAILASMGAPAYVSGTPLNEANVTFAMVSGAFHVLEVLDTLSSLIQAQGYDVRTAGLVTVNDPQMTIKNDVLQIQDMLLHPLIEQQGKDVFLYVHSYASIASSAAIQGYSKQERLAAGKQGGIIGLVYQSGFIPRPGDTLLHLFGGSYPPWQDPKPHGLVSATDPQSIFFNNVTNEALAQQATRQIYGQSTKSFNTPSGNVYYTESYYNERRVYIETKYDQALPIAKQEAFLANSTVTWEKHVLDSDHSPWLSVPSTLAPLLISILHKFAATY